MKFEIIILDDTPIREMPYIGEIIQQRISEAIHLDQPFEIWNIYAGKYDNIIGTIKRK